MIKNQRKAATKKSRKSLYKPLEEESMEMYPISADLTRSSSQRRSSQSKSSFKRVNQSNTFKQPKTPSRTFVCTPRTPKRLTQTTSSIAGSSHKSFSRFISLVDENNNNATTINNNNTTSNYNATSNFNTTGYNTTSINDTTKTCSCSNNANKSIFTASFMEVKRVSVDNARNSDD
jgi:hypothetical protein